MLNLTAQVDRVVLNQISFNEEREPLIPVSYHGHSDHFYWRRITSFDEEFIEVYFYQLKQYLQLTSNTAFQYYCHVIAKEKSILEKFISTSSTRFGIRRTRGYDRIIKSGPVTIKTKQLNKFVNNHNIHVKTTIHQASLTALLNFKILQKMVKFHDADHENSFKWIQANVHRLMNNNILFVEDPSSTGFPGKHYFFNVGIHKRNKGKSGVKSGAKSSAKSGAKAGEKPAKSNLEQIREKLFYTTTEAIIKGVSN
jgi:hypothetical protein